MTIEEASRLLARMCHQAPEGEKVVHIHLFGIKYADEIQGMSLSELAVRANLPKSYGTELAKGRALARFVTVK